MASSYDRARRQQVDPNAATEQPSPDDLAEAERAVRVTAVSWSRHDDKALEIVMAEYDRLKAENAELKWNAAAAEDAEWD